MEYLVSTSIDGYQKFSSDNYIYAKNAVSELLLCGPDTLIEEICYIFRNGECGSLLT